MQMLNLNERMDSAFIIGQRAILLLGYPKSISKSNTLLQKGPKPEPTEPRSPITHPSYLSGCKKNRIILSLAYSNIAVHDWS
jgi:hypothetical protein